MNNRHRSFIAAPLLLSTSLLLAPPVTADPLMLIDLIADPVSGQRETAINFGGLQFGNWTFSSESFYTLDDHFLSSVGVNIYQDIGSISIDFFYDPYYMGDYLAAFDEDMLDLTIGFTVDVLDPTVSLTGAHVEMAGAYLYNDYYGGDFWPNWSTRPFNPNDPDSLHAYYGGVDIEGTIEDGDNNTLQTHTVGYDVSVYDALYSVNEEDFASFGGWTDVQSLAGVNNTETLFVETIVSVWGDYYGDEVYLAGFGYTFEIPTPTSLWLLFMGLCAAVPYWLGSQARRTS
jgi:hypothetical protein